MSLVEKTLRKIGLTDNEIAVYLESLKYEELSPHKIAKLTGIPRTTVYDVIMGLSLKGLVELEQSDGFSKQQTTIRGKNPSILRKMLQDKRKDLVKTELDVVHILPELKKDFHQEKSNADFRFYPGIQGATEVYFAIPDVDTDLYVWENLMPMDVFGMEQVNKDVDIETKRRLKGKVTMRELVALNDWTKHVLTYQCGRDPNYLKVREIRYIDNPSLVINQRIVLAEGHIRIVNIQDDEVWGLIINSYSLSKTLISIYQHMWQSAIPITNDIVKSWGENELLKQEKLGK